MRHSNICILEASLQRQGGEKTLARKILLLWRLNLSKSILSVLWPDRTTEQEKIFSLPAIFHVNGNAAQKKLCGLCLFLSEREEREERQWKTMKHLCMPLHESLVFAELLYYTQFSADHTINRPWKSTRKFQAVLGYVCDTGSICTLVLTCHILSLSCFVQTITVTQQNNSSQSPKHLPSAFLMSHFQ